MIFCEDKIGYLQDKHIKIIIDALQTKREAILLLFISIVDYLGGLERLENYSTKLGL